METTKERDTALIVEMLPQILATADRFDGWARAAVAYEDLLNHADSMITAVSMFAGDDIEEVASLAFAGARKFEESGSLAFVAMGRYIMLDVICSHPELLALAAQRAKDEVWQALQHGTIPARLAHGRTFPPEPEESSKDE
jgi:hypothetical protein